MSKQRVITVFGATGTQGGGLARAILADPKREFTVRAVTRKPDSPKGRALAAAGAEIVAADLDDVSSLERAMTGAHGVFGVTNFWEHFSAPKEYEQATNLAEAARRAEVAHVIWSTLEDTRKWIPLSDNRMPTLQGKYKVPHFDAKGESDQVFTQLGVPTTFLLTSFYWENFIFFGLGPKRGGDGVLAVTYPMGDKRLPSIAVEDIGKCAYGIFKRGGELIGQTVGVAGEHPTGAEIAAALTRALGEEVRYNDVPPDVFRSFGFPGADDIGNMFQFKADFNDLYCANRSVEFSRSLNPELQTLDQWMAANKDRIPLGGAG